MYEGDDPDGYALTVNIARRSLTKGQKAMVVAKACSFNEQTQRGLVERTGLSKAYIVKASTVLAHAPDLADAVVSGAQSLDATCKRARGSDCRNG